MVDVSLIQPVSQAAAALGVCMRFPALLISGGILWYWEKFGPMILISRKVHNWPRVMVEVEFLAGKVIEYGRLHPELQISVPDSLAG